jgi:hypothetical protein
VLAHGLVRGSFDDDFGPRRDQPFDSEHEGHAELARERLAPGIFVAAGDRHHLRPGHVARARVLEKKPRDDASAEKADPHVSRAALSS